MPFICHKDIAIEEMQIVAPLARQRSTGIVKYISFCKNRHIGTLVMNGKVVRFISGSCPVDFGNGDVVSAFLHKRINLGGAISMVAYNVEKLR